MALSRANVESILVQRIGGWLTNAGLATTIAGANQSLNDPLGYAIRVAGGTVTSYALVVDADVSTVADANLDKLLDVAELRALENVLSNYALVDAKAGPVEAKSSQFADRLMKVIDRLRAQLAVRYGIEGTVGITTGVISLNFTELNDNIYIRTASARTIRDKSHLWSAQLLCRLRSQYTYPIPIPTYPQPHYPSIPIYPSYPITICTTDSTKDYTLIS
jgi:hypothetical protein